MNYTELQAAIQNYAEVSEATFVTHLPDFVRAAEDVIYGAIENKEFFRAVSDAALVANTAEYAVGAIGGGSGLGVMDVLSVRISATPAVATPVQINARYLIQKDYDFMLEAYPGDVGGLIETGLPKYYAVVDRTVVSNEIDMTIRLGPAPDDTYPMTVTYVGKITTDSITLKSPANGTQETWLSIAFPDALVKGALSKAYGTFLRGDPDLQALYEKEFLDWLAVIKNVTETREMHDSYRRAVA